MSRRLRSKRQKRRQERKRLNPSRPYKTLQSHNSPRLTRRSWKCICALLSFCCDIKRPKGMFQIGRCDIGTQTTTRQTYEGIIRTHGSSPQKVRSIHARGKHADNRPQHIVRTHHGETKTRCGRSKMRDGYTARQIRQKGGAHPHPGDETTTETPPVS